MGIVASIGSWLASKLFTFKALGVLIVLVALGYGQYRFYDWSNQRGYTSGVASQADTIKSLKDQLNTALTGEAEAKASLTQWQDKYNTYVKTSTQQVADLKKAYAASQASSTATINQLQAALAQKQKELTDALSSYVSATADASCIVPMGFVQLYNLSLEGIPPVAGATSAAGFALAGAPRTTQDLPSGLSLSDVTRVIVLNNNAAVANRELVLAWQAWWQQVSADYQQYQQQHGNTPAPTAQLLAPPKEIATYEPSADPLTASIQAWRGRASQLATRGLH